MAKPTACGLSTGRFEELKWGYSHGVMTKMGIDKLYIYIYTIYIYTIYIYTLYIYTLYIYIYTIYIYTLYT